MSPFGFWMIRCTAWIAVAAWLLRLLVELVDRDFSRKHQLTRWSWLAGALAITAHLIAAMGFAHHWSLENALRHTAIETHRVLGIVLAESLYVNFAFVGFWLVDAVKEFRASCRPQLGPVRHLIWATMMINATVVFGPVYWRWLSIPCVAGLTVAALLRKARPAAEKEKDPQRPLDPGA